MSAKRLALLRQLLERAECQAFLITHTANLRYYSGYSGDSAYLLLDGENAFFFTDGRYITQATAEIPTTIELIKIKSFQDVCNFIDKHHPGKLLGIDEEHLPVSQWLKLRSGLDWEPRPAASWLNQPRQTKDPEEIKLLQRAITIAESALRSCLSLLKPGIREKEIAAEIEFQMRRGGAESSAFPIIVASGPRSALPHGVASDRILTAPEIVTIDFGAVYQGYHSDQTLTFFIGQPEIEVQKVYEQLSRAQAAGCAALADQLSARELDAVVRNELAAAGLGEAFSHGTGHGVGLEIHEAPSISPLSDHGSLSPGMVFTIEPGCYFPGRWGIRLEDMILQTESGPEKLTHLDKSLQRVVIE